MANPFAMTEEENAAYNAKVSPFTTYMIEEDPTIKLLRKKKAMEEERALSSKAVAPPEPPDVDLRRMLASDEVQESPEEKEYKRKLQEKLDQDMAAQQSGVADLQKQYDDYGQNQRTDISSILGAFDILGGTDNASKYKRPDSPDELRTKKAAIGKMLQEAKSGISELDLKRLGMIATDKQSQRALEAASRQGRFDESTMLKKEDKIGGWLDSNVIKPYAEKQQQFGLLDAAFAKGDYQTVGATLAQFARGVSGEKGVLTDTDINRIMPRNIYGDAAKIRSYFSTTPSDKLPTEYLDKLKELIELAKTNANTVYGDVLKSKRGVYSKSNSYSDLFTKGGSGDLMFSEIEQKIAPQKEPTKSAGGAAAPKTTTTKQKFKLPDGSIVEAD